VAVIFSPIVKFKILSKNEVDPLRLLIVRAEIDNLIFLFVNIYAPNIGAERIRLFTELEDFLRQNEGDLIILGGDFNCTLDFTQDRNGEEPHIQSALCLSNVIKNLNLSDVWREHNLYTWQYTVHG